MCDLVAISGSYRTAEILVYIKPPKKVDLTISPTQEKGKKCKVIPFSDGLHPIIFILFTIPDNSDDLKIKPFDSQIQAHM